VEVTVKNFGKTKQVRTLRLYLNGTPVGPGVVVTLVRGKEQREETVKFNVQFNTPGIATLKASLSPADSNPANDTRTKTVVVERKGKDNGGKGGKGGDDDDGDDHHDDDDDR
jgi:hypothetical protein